MRINTDIEMLRPALRLAISDEKYLFCLHKLPSITRVILLIYNRFIPIELLPQNEKLELWNYVKPKSNSQSEALLMCKVIYTVSKLYESVPNVAK